MQSGSFSHMPDPPTDWLQLVADRKLKLTGANVWKAMRYRSFVHVLDQKQQVMDSVTKLDDCSGFKITERGLALLESSKNKVELPFRKGDLPKGHELWLSALRRCARNVPKSFVLAHKDGEMHVLITDLEGKVANDDAHRIASFKVPWHDK